MDKKFNNKSAQKIQAFPSKANYVRGLMCLALPGKILSIYQEGNLTMAEVDFSGVKKSVCIAYVPEAKVGDYVVVHVGFAISLLNVDEAKKTLELAREIRR